MLDSLLAAAFLFACGGFIGLFCLLRLRYRLRRRRGRDSWAPEVAALGNALHTVQIVAVPQIEHVMEEKLAAPVEECDAGEVEPQAKYNLRLQLEQVRRGERDRISAIHAPRP